jgi:hypothetical protein
VFYQTNACVTASGKVPAILTERFVISLSPQAKVRIKASNRLLIHLIRQHNLLNLSKSLNKKKVRKTPPFSYRDESVV